LFAKNLGKQDIDFDYEGTKLKYIKEHQYSLDFSLESGKILIETKGYFKASDRQKMLDLKKQHPDKDIRFIFMGNNKLHKLSETRYGDWATKHGFKWCVSPKAELPKEWLEELKKK
jgi:hypothetical protein